MIETGEGGVMISEKKAFQFKLSDEQEQKALEYYQKSIERLRHSWQSDGLSKQLIEEKTPESLESARVAIYYLGCLSKIHNLLKKQYGKEFAQLAYEIDHGFGTLEGAEQITKLLIKIQAMLDQGITKEKLQEEINPFSSRYWKEALRRSAQEFQEAQKNVERLKQQLEEAQTQLVQKKTASYAISSSDDLENVAVSSSVVFSNQVDQGPVEAKGELKRVLDLTGNSSGDPTNQEKKSRLS